MGARATGGVYEGEMQDGERHGRGKYTFPSGAVYDGEWQHGKRHGHGRHVDKEGDVYVGQPRVTARSMTAVGNKESAAGQAR